MTTAELERLDAERAARIPADRLMAPFAEFPSGEAPTGDFNVAGHCPGCHRFCWISYFTVWPSPKAWPPIATSGNAYCRDCMLLMGVGTDDRVS